MDSKQFCAVSLQFDAFYSYRGSRSVHSEFATFKCTALYCTDPKLPCLYFIGKCGVGTVLTQKMVLVLNLDSDDLHRSWVLT